MSAPLVVSEADIRPSLRRAIGRSWNAVGKPGANWSARDRVAFAQATVDAMAGDGVQGQSRTMAFIELLAADPEPDGALAPALVRSLGLHLHRSSGILSSDEHRYSTHHYFLTTPTTNRSGVQNPLHKQGVFVWSNPPWH